MTLPTFNFVKATKKAAKARIALDGVSGSGKTYTSLTIASALGQRIAVIDTEHQSASKYASIFDFDTLPLDSYDPRILIAALAAAGEAGYEVVIVDSLSHFWMGSGGMLEQVDMAAKRSGSTHGMSGWKEMRPVERQMIEAMLAYPGHVIATMRVKNDWVEGEVRGRKAMVKVGTKAEQREGLEYEFDIVGSLNLDNELIVSKSRCPQLAGAVVSKPDLEFGRTIREWLEDGEAAPTAADFRARAIAAAGNMEALRPLHAEARAAGLLAAPVLDPAGAPVSLGDLIVQLGRQAPAAAGPEPAESAPEQTPPAAEPRPAPTATSIRDWALKSDRTADGIRKAAAKLMKEHPAVAAERITNEHGDDEQLSVFLDRRARELDPAAAAPADDEQEAKRRKRMFALFRDLGFDGDANREKRREIASKILRREIVSMTEVVGDDQETVIKALEDRKRTLRQQQRQGAAA